MLVRDGLMANLTHTHTYTCTYRILYENKRKSCMFSLVLAKIERRRKKRHENAVNLHLSHLVRWMHKIKRSLVLTAVIVVAVFVAVVVMIIWRYDCQVAAPLQIHAQFFLSQSDSNSIGYEWA